ncbi:MAG: extracellular solute-binding protein [Pontiellaceae bacterium]|nr:extracellular solute-binding protein [Pontiellaceae bacterium]MBN2783261.1 extracellular solute-binding protein [Pontiellaceae bacterium]
MIQLGLLDKLDHSKIPNIKHLTETFTSPSFDPGNKYSAAYQWGTVGLIYDTNKIKEPIDSWKPILEPADRTKFELFVSLDDLDDVVAEFMLLFRPVG